jgi:hypothetical protein
LNLIGSASIITISLFMLHAMVSLEHLADELILEILSNLEHDKKALKQVALVCSRLHRLAQPLMVRHLSLTLNNNPSSFDRFVRSVNQNPDLATMVRTIELFWFQRGPKVHKSINGLLAKLTRLRGLSLSTFADTTPYQPEFLRYNKLKDVSEVALSDTFLTIETVARFMFLDRIKVMTIEALPDQAVPAVPDSYVKAMKTSPLVDLYFNWECFLALDVLAKFLEAPEALQRLTSPTPGTLRLTSGTRRIMTNVLSPCSISHALLPTFDSLVDLTITDRFFPIFSGHDSTRLNLHEFTRLKICRVPANLFFHDEEAHPSRNGLYEVFPGSLEILEAS